jgi:hypothetical protein
MKTVFIEAVSAAGNWGKFAVCRWDQHEWARLSRLPDQPGLPVLALHGRRPDHVWVLDLATGEGAHFVPGGLAAADLEKHRVWVCPLFEPFLTWLYKQDLEDIETLPAYVEIPNVPLALSGRRRRGPIE